MWLIEEKISSIKQLAAKLNYPVFEATGHNRGWINKHPQWGGIIAGSIVGEEYVRSCMAFRWQMFQVTAPVAAGNALREDLQSDVDALGDILFGELAKAAGEA